MLFRNSQELLLAVLNALLCGLKRPARQELPVIDDPRQNFTHTHDSVQKVAFGDALNSKCNICYSVQYWSYDA